MSSTSIITQHRVPSATAAAVVVAIVALGAVVSTQHDATAPAQSPHTTQIGVPDPNADYQRPAHSGVQTGL